MNTKISAPAIECKDVTKKFGGLTAVKNVNFSLESGKIMGLIGPNGAGKTTLFNVISGVYRPEPGKILFYDEKISGLKPEQVCKKGIGRTFQIPKPFGNMSTIDNVVVGTLLNTKSVDEARDKAAAILKKVHLDKKQNVTANTLTVAERKRLEVAKALGSDPRVLLLDEVMAGLNPSEIEEIIEILRGINKDGSTLLIIEHVMSAVMRLCEILVVLSNGEKIAEGTPKEISVNEHVIKAYLGEEYKHA